MNADRFSDISLRIYPLVRDEISRLRELSGYKEVLPIGRSIWDIVSMITSLVDSHLGRGDQVIPEFHIPWMTQVLLKRGTTEKDLRLDTESQTLYETVPDMHIPITGLHICDSIFSQIPDARIFNWFVNNIDQVCDVLNQVVQPSLAEGKDILILSNHATWFNLPLIAHCLHRIFGIPKENIYTIIGPAITHSQFSLAGILRFSNALKTSPDTPKADIGYSGIGRIREVFLDGVQKILNQKNTTGYPRVLLLAPSGTTDVYDGKNLVMNPASEGTKILIKLLVRRLHLLGIVLGVNDLDVIHPGSSRPEKKGGKVYIRGVSIDDKSWETQLPKQIVDQYGNTIAQWAEQ